MPVIAMTREIGSLGTDVAAGLAANLGLKIIDSDIAVNTAAGSLGVGQTTVQRYMDGSASMFERWRINKSKLSRYTSEQILKLAQEGNVLIRGWGAAALFQGIPHVIKVRICAPMAFREHIINERLGGSKEADAIRAEIERYDAARASTIRDSFNIDRENARLYHIVLNTSELTIDTCVKTICLLAQDPQFQDDAAARAAIVDKLLAIKVSAELRERLGVEMATIVVSAANGKIILEGNSSATFPARAEKMARGIDGVHDIENRIVGAPNPEGF